jgi:cytochrome P450
VTRRPDADGAARTPPAKPRSNGHCDFDPLSDDLATRPHEVYADLRDRCPVAHSDRWGGFTVLTRYRDVVKAATQPRVFTSAQGIVVPKNPVSGRRAPMHFDPPEHTRYRRAMNAVFREDRVLAREGEVRALAGALLDPLVGRIEPWDLVADFSSPFTCQVLARFLSLDDNDADVLDEHTQRFEHAQVALDHDTAEAENQFLYEMARRIVRARSRAPLDPEHDLITRLLSLASDQDDPQEFVAGTIRQLFIAGHVAPTVAIGAVGLALIDDRALEQRLRSEPNLIEPAVEELLRLHTPNQGFSRTAAAATTVRGRHINAGELVVLSYPSANRDPDVFPEPDQLVLGRTPNKHLAFGSGVHKCVGATLARLELRVAVDELLSRTERLERAGDQVVFPWPMLGPASIPVRSSARR